MGKVGDTGVAVKGVDQVGSNGGIRAAEAEEGN